VKIFPFKRKRKIATEIERFCALLEENPGDVESRLKLAHLYHRVGAQKSAMREYWNAATKLSAEGLDLEAIATYQQILTLDHIFPDKQSTEAAQEAEDLLILARKAYERVLSETSQEMGPTESSDLHHPIRQPRDDNAKWEETTDRNDDEPVPIEMLLDSSSDQEVPRTSPHEKSDKGLPAADTSLLEGINQKSPTVSDEGTLVPLPDGQVSKPTDLSHRGGRREVRTDGEHGGEAFETAAPGKRPESSTKGWLGPILFDDHLERDLLTTTSQGEELEPHQAASIRRTAGTPPGLPNERESALHYSLGVAYYETNCIDEAIKEFVKAHNQGGKPVDSLSMVAKCYYRKGLFLNSAGLVYQALRREDLTRDQIDMLRTQLEQIKVRAV
jgi:tetratricopeptide (TPR) repeat protein